MPGLDPRLPGLTISLRDSVETPVKAVVPELGPGIHVFGINACVGRSHMDTRIKSGHDVMWSRVNVVRLDMF